MFFLLDLIYILEALVWLGVLVAVGTCVFLEGPDFLDEDLRRHLRVTLGALTWIIVTACLWEFSGCVLANLVDVWVWDN